MVAGGTRDATRRSPWSSPPRRALERIAACGYGAVEITAEGAHLDPRLAPDVAAAARAVRRSGLEVVSVHLPYHGLALGHPTECDLAESARLLERAIGSAAAVGAPLAVLHPCSFFTDVPVTQRGRAVDTVRRTVEVAVAAGERCGVRIVLENLVSYGVWRVGTSVAELADLFPDPRVGLCLDVGHVPIERLGLAAEVGAAGERLALLHLDDNDGTRDLHLAPGEGVLDWAAIAPALRHTRARRVLELAARDDADEVLERVAAMESVTGPDVQSTSHTRTERDGARDRPGRRGGRPAARRPAVPGRTRFPGLVPGNDA